MRPVFSLAIFLLSVTISAFSASATTVRSFTTEQLTLGASVIIEGRCLSMHSEWVEGNLVTSATIQVDARLKGAPTSLISVVLPGGIDRDRAVPVQVTVPGTPTMALNEEVLLFLVPFTAKPDAYTVLGMAQGKFSLVTGASGQKQANADLRGLHTTGAGTAATQLELQHLREQIATVLAQGSREARP